MNNLIYLIFFYVFLWAAPNSDSIYNQISKSDVYCQDYQYLNSTCSVQSLRMLNNKFFYDAGFDLSSGMFYHLYPLPEHRSNTEQLFLSQLFLLFLIMLCNKAHAKIYIMCMMLMSFLIYILSVFTSFPYPGIFYSSHVALKQISAVWIGAIVLCTEKHFFKSYLILNLYAFATISYFLATKTVLTKNILIVLCISSFICLSLDLLIEKLYKGFIIFSRFTLPCTYPIFSCFVKLYRVASGDFGSDLISCTQLTQTPKADMP